MRLFDQVGFKTLGRLLPVPWAAVNFLPQSSVIIVTFDNLTTNRWMAWQLYSRWRATRETGSRRTSSPQPKTISFYALHYALHVLFVRNALQLYTRIQLRSKRGIVWAAGHACGFIAGHQVRR